MNTIQNAINKAGCIVTRELLKTFDTAGEDIQVGLIKMTTKGLINKAYQTLYGEVEVQRHVYQTSAGWLYILPVRARCKNYFNVNTAIRFVSKS